MLCSPNPCTNTHTYLTQRRVSVDRDAANSNSLFAAHQNLAKNRPGPEFRANTEHPHKSSRCGRSFELLCSSFCRCSVASFQACAEWAKRGWPKVGCDFWQRCEERSCKWPNWAYCGWCSSVKWMCTTRGIPEKRVYFKLKKNIQELVCAEWNGSKVERVVWCEHFAIIFN